MPNIDSASVRTRLSYFRGMIIWWDFLKVKWYVLSPISRKRNVVRGLSRRSSTSAEGSLHYYPHGQRITVCQIVLLTQLSTLKLFASLLPPHLRGFWICDVRPNERTIAKRTQSLAMCTEELCGNVRFASVTTGGRINNRWLLRAISQ